MSAGTLLLLFSAPPGDVTPFPIPPPGAHLRYSPAMLGTARVVATCAVLLVAADAESYARHLAIPWGRRDGRVLIATANPGPDMVLHARRQWGAATRAP